jgi:hypothetical protein
VTSRHQEEEEEEETEASTRKEVKRSFNRIFGDRFAHMVKRTKFAGFIFSKGYDAGYRAAKKEEE